MQTLLPPAAGGLALALMLVPAGAQRVAPAVASNWQTEVPFGYRTFRFQQLYTADQLAASTGTIREIAFRPTASAKTFPALRLPGFELWMGHTRAPSGALQVVFANNRGADHTRLLSTTYDLPALPPGPRSFSIRWKLPRPFVWDARQGSLLVEWVSPGLADLVGTDWRLDGRLEGPFGSNRTIGTGGRFGNGDRLIYDVMGPTITPGGAIRFHAVAFRQAYPTVVMLGPNDAWGAIRLPFDMAAIGAHDNTLHVAPQVMLPLPMRFQGHFFEAVVELPIPDDPSLSNQLLHSQAAAIHVPANPLGVVTSAAKETLIGQGEPRVHGVFSNGSLGPTGRFLADPTLIAGVVTELTGTFQ